MLSKTVGLARVIAEVPLSDGSTAQDIRGFFVRESGVLDSTFRLMPLIPNQWRGASQPEPLGRGVFGMCHTLVRGTIPELLILTPGALTSGGVWRFAPWGRGDGGASPGLEEAQQYHADGTSAQAPVPSATRRGAPTFVPHDGRIYFTFGDGGPVWVWDRWGNRTRVAGYRAGPAAPGVDGPQRVSASSPNGGGFGVRGRIGTTDGSWTTTTNATVGGIDNGRWEYAYCWENTAGGYSPTSSRGGLANILLQLADTAVPGTYIENLTRRFRVHSLQTGPDGTSALILLRTYNLFRLPPNDTGQLHFLHRISSDLVSEYVDDIPDGELGAVWANRAPFPGGADALASFGGSLWIFKGSRAWFTEQEQAGPVYESIMATGWRDVYPSTGDTVAAIPLRGRAEQATPMLAVLKRDAAHYLAGAYPNWQIGTLHPQAGCDGAQLVQAVPDGSVLWYGSGTFWRSDPDNPIPVDVGAPIRRKLRRVNTLRSPFGCSWVDKRAGEVVFALPLDDNTLNEWQFVWDYRAQGWRTRRDVKIRAACVVGDLVLLAGQYDSIDTLWAYQRGYPNFSVTYPTALYVTGWASYGEGPDLHASFHSSDLVFVCEERAHTFATVAVYQDWNLDTVSTTLDSDQLRLDHPEDSGIPIAGTAVYDTDVWRSRRYFSSRVTVDIPHHEVMCVSVSAAGPLALVNIDVFGQLKAPPPGQTPMYQP